MTEATEAMAETAAAPGPEVEILLATYNNARWLEPLLESLLAQSVQDFRLLISDDCSSDGSVAILERYLPRFRDARLIRRDSPSGSAMANFASLMQISTGAHVFLCDADDIWDPDKIERFLTALGAREAAVGAGVPIMLYSDARIIDGEGRPSHPSYWGFKKIYPERCNALPRLLVCPPMLGCASVMNRALVRLSAAVPVGRVTGHDWWAALVAGALGEIAHLPDGPTISYRVHGQNSSQPKHVTLRGLGRLVNRVSGPAHEVRRRMEIRRRQAEPLLEQFPQMPAAQRETVARFLGIGGRSFVMRRLLLLRYGYTYPDLLRNAAVLTFC